MIYETHFLFALFITIAIETLVVFLLLYKDVGFFKRVSAGILPTALTLPYIWFVFPAFLGMGEFYRWVSEIFAVIIEAWMICLIASISLYRAFFISLTANVASFIIGMIILRV